LNNGRAKIEERPKTEEVVISPPYVGRHSALAPSFKPSKIASSRFTGLPMTVFLFKPLIL